MVVVLCVKANHAEACVDGIAPVVENVGKRAMDEAGGINPRVAAISGIVYMHISAMTLLVKE